MPAGAGPEAPSKPPASASSFAVNCALLALCLAGIFRLREVNLDQPTKVLYLAIGTAIPMVLYEIIVRKTHRNATTGIDWDKPFNTDLARVLTKILGLAATVGIIAFAYWLFPEYHGEGASFYDPFYRLLRNFAPFFLIAAPVYIYLIDGKMREPRDAYWQLGRCVLFRFSDATSFEIANHFRGWLVKAYFLPLMLVYMHQEVGHVLTFRFANAEWNNLVWYDFLYALVFGLDVTFATIGYALSLKALDSHVRTAEPTMLGWAVALFCYQPFFSLMERQYVGYETGFGFGAWLSAVPALRLAWAVVILLLLTIYVLATVSFGYRFSNLTHRGILTNGPYRFSKHPAYLSKNIAWWLVSVPFVPRHGALDAFRHSMLLVCVNAIYFLRARTEERHLSRDPTYVAYALWINEHGVLRALGRRFPLLRYRPPATVEANVAESAVAAE